MTLEFSLQTLVEVHVVRGRQGYILGFWAESGSTCMSESSTYTSTIA